MLKGSRFGQKYNLIKIKKNRAQKSKNIFVEEMKVFEFRPKNRISFSRRIILSFAQFNVLWRTWALWIRLDRIFGPILFPIHKLFGSTCR